MFISLPSLTQQDQFLEGGTGFEWAPNSTRFFVAFATALAATGQPRGESEVLIKHRRSSTRRAHSDRPWTLTQALGLEQLNLTSARLTHP